MNVLVERSSSNLIFDGVENTLVGRLLSKCGQGFDEDVVLENNFAFDYNANAWSHRIRPDYLNPHGSKDAETFFSVAAMSDRNSVVEI